MIWNPLRGKRSNPQKANITSQNGRMLAPRRRANRRAQAIRLAHDAIVPKSVNSQGGTSSGWLLSSRCGSWWAGLLLVLRRSFSKTFSTRGLILKTDTSVNGEGVPKMQNVFVEMSSSKIFADNFLGGHFDCIRQQRSYRRKVQHGGGYRFIHRLCTWDECSCRRKGDHRKDKNYHRQVGKSSGRDVPGWALDIISISDPGNGRRDQLFPLSGRYQTIRRKC